MPPTPSSSNATTKPSNGPRFHPAARASETETEQLTKGRHRRPFQKESAMYSFKQKILSALMVLSIPVLTLASNPALAEEAPASPASSDAASHRMSRRIGFDLGINEP